MLKVIKLITGETLVSKTEKIDNGYSLENPVQVVYQPSQVEGEQPNVGFAPVIIFGDSQIGKGVVEIKEEHVLYCYNPAADIENGYNQSGMGSGIQIASVTDIQNR
jgi:hypothetical protein